MEANPVRIIKYFDGTNQSLIPLFQRPYTWEWNALHGRNRVVPRQDRSGGRE
jgi:hypothetical protein